MPGRIDNQIFRINKLPEIPLETYSLLVLSIATYPQRIFQQIYRKQFREQF